MVLSAVVWRTENCYNGREGSRSAPPMHLVAVDLNLMRSNDRNVIILLQQFLEVPDRI
jgi:hypothetical protein